jgi:hypothetical protein
MLAFLITGILTISQCFALTLTPTDRKPGQDRLAFRTHCAPLLHARIDPIIGHDQRVVSQHVHTVTGARSFGYAVTAADFDPALGSTCNIPEDMSMYWAPALYYKDKGTLRIVKTTHTHYYISIGDGYIRKGNKLHSFPRGLRVIVGDNNNRSERVGQGWPSWHCIVDQPGSKNLFLNKPSYSKLPPRFAPDGRECVSWQANMLFPNCWDGVSLDAPDHKSHMAYMPNFGSCPKSHPILVPQLLFQVEFHLGDIPTNARAPDFVLSNGDVTMGSFHGDYIAGFDENVLAKLMVECQRDKGAKCPMARFANLPGIDGLHPLKELPSEKVDNITRLVLGPGTFAPTTACICP